MKFITSIILIAFLSIAACLYLPWWSIAIVSFVVSIAIPQKPAKAFLAGFIALYAVWGLLAWYLSSANAHLLAHKVSLLIIKTDSPLALISITALIGAIVAGFAALSGSYLRKT
jgi:hypothetical protein